MAVAGRKVRALTCGRRRSRSWPLNPNRLKEAGPDPSEHRDSNTRTRTMFAVIKTGGKQYRVVADDKLQVEKVAGEPGEIIQFGEVLVVGGDSVTLGVPTVAGASVAAEVIEQS